MLNVLSLFDGISGCQETMKSLLSTVFCYHHNCTDTDYYYLKYQNWKKISTSLVFNKRCCEQKIAKNLSQSLPTFKIESFHQWLCLILFQGNNATKMQTMLTNAIERYIISILFINIKDNFIIKSNNNFIIFKLKVLKTCIFTKINKYLIDNKNSFDSLVTNNAVKSIVCGSQNPRNQKSLWYLTIYSKNYTNTQQWCICESGVGNTIHDLPFGSIVLSTLTGVFLSQNLELKYMLNNLKTIPFNGDNIIATIYNKEVHVALKPICENLTIDWASQYKNTKGRNFVKRYCCNNNTFKWRSTTNGLLTT